VHINLKKYERKMKMPDFILQQVPDTCFAPVTIGDFVVTLVDIEPVDGGFRWIYRVDNVGIQNALSNWVLGIDVPCLDFITEALASEVFDPATEPTPTELFPVDFESPGQTPQPGCPEGVCGPAGTIIEGFAFIPDQDQFGELQEGLSQLFAITVNQPAVATTACASITAANVNACGEICVPDCVVCENPCDCDEAVDTFDVDVTLPSDCFTFTGTGEGGITIPADVRFGYCIGDVTDTGPVACEAPAEIFACGQTIVCCCGVNAWTRTVGLDIQFNIPKTADCLSDNIGEGEFLYECVNDTPTVTQVCITCEDELTSPFVPADELDCTNVTVTINSVTDNGDGTATINYTVNLPECVVADDDDDLPGTPAPPSCPPPAPAPRNNPAVNKSAVNRTIRRRR
jgi:hypothetical protein